jgi:hypothetical protein
VSILYRHTQRTPVALTLALLALFIVLLDGLLASSWAPASYIVFIDLVFAAAGAGIFYLSSITVEVSDSELRWRFGPGPIRRLPRQDIDGVRRVRDPWWGGYGTTLFGIGYFPPRRWTYRIAGRDAVEVRLKAGGWRRIGTDDAQGLAAALGADGR